MLLLSVVGVFRLCNQPTEVSLPPTMAGFGVRGAKVPPRVGIYRGVLKYRMLGLFRGMVVWSVCCVHQRDGLRTRRIIHKTCSHIIFIVTRWTEFKGRLGINNHI